MIRKMESEDIEEVVKIEQSIFSNPWSKKSFQDALQSEQNIYLVAIIDTKVVGYCGLWTSFECADLCNIAVKKEYRRRQLAQSLLLEGFQIARQKKVEKILLEVRESNFSAQKLYQKMGFHQIGVRKRYYTAPEEDALLFEKILPGFSTIQK